MIVDERGRGQYAGSVGWFINTLPVEIQVARGAGFAALLAETRWAWAAGREHADVHYARAWELIAPDDDHQTRYWTHWTPANRRRTSAP